MVGKVSCPVQGDVCVVLLVIIGEARIGGGNGVFGYGFHVDQFVIHGKKQAVHQPFHKTFGIHGNFRRRFRSLFTGGSKNRIRILVVGGIIHIFENRQTIPNDFNHVSNVDVVVKICFHEMPGQNKFRALV